MLDMSKFPIELLQQNIEARENQIESLGTSHRDYAYLLLDMSEFWVAIFRQSGGPSDLDSAVDVAREALRLMLPTDPDPAFILGQLAAVLFTKFMASGRSDDLDETLDFSDRAVQAAKFPTAQWMQLRSNHNMYLIEKFMQFGNAEDLDDIVENSRILIDLKAKVDCPLTIAKLYKSYSVYLCSRAIVRSSTVELDEGISTGYQALELCKQEDPEYAEIINNLAVRVINRYERTQMLESLREALRLSQLAVDTVPEGHHYRPTTLMTHSVFLFHLSERVRKSDPPISLKSIQDAISLIKEALSVNLESGQWSNYLKITALDYLSAWLGLKLKLTGDVNAGREAVEVAEKAIDLIKPGYREKPTVLNNLACSLDALYAELRTRDPDQARTLLDHGIQIATFAVNESDEADYRYAERMLTFAALRAKLYKETKDDDEFREVRKIWLSASQCSSARPVIRISAGLKAGHASFADYDFETAYEVLTSAIELFPRIIIRSISSADQQYLLTQSSGIAGLAAAASLQIGKHPYEAVRSLEAGRCITSGLSMNVKDDVSELKEAHPELYRRYDDLRQSYQLDSRTAQTSFIALCRNSTQVNNDLTSVENEIRAKEGLRIYSYRHLKSS